MLFHRYRLSSSKTENKKAKRTFALNPFELDPALGNIILLLLLYTTLRANTMEITKKRLCNAQTLLNIGGGLGIPPINPLIS